MVSALRLSSDTIPHASELLAALRSCRQVIRDAQTEVIPFGPGYRACAHATASLETLAHFITGELDIASTRPARAPQKATLYDEDDLSF